MTTYAAVISLKDTIERLLKSRHISIVQNISSKILSFQYAQVVSLEQLMEKLNENIDAKTKLDNIISMEEQNKIDELLREQLHEVEDVIETCVSKAYLAQYGHDHEVRSSSSPLLLDLEEWKRDLHSLTAMLKEIQENIKIANNFYDEYDGLGDSSDEPSDLSPDVDYKLFEDDEDEDNDEGSCEHRSKVVGLSNLLSEVREQLMSSFVLHDGMVHLWGMAGVGKTTLAKEVLKDPLIKQHFKRRILIRVGPNRKFGEFVRELNVLFHDVFHSKVCKRDLLVLDDVWSFEALEILKGLLPDLRYGKRILVTTRIGSVAEPEVNRYTNLIPFLSGEDSWILLRDGVFGENDCPRELEKPGRKIAEVCAGLPLTIVTVAKILSQSEKTAEYWNQVAAKQTSVFFDAYEEMSEVLLPSYDYLPQHIKPCFLYFGILPEDDVISHSKLINLWAAEGFIPKDLIGSLFEFATKSLVALVSRNVLILHRDIRILVSWSGLDTNRYQLHPAFLHLCVREAKKAKFHHVLNHYIHDAAEVLQGQRRLCIHNNVLFAIKDLYDSMSSVTTVRSLLCTGSYHQYPVPICFDLMLLRVLDALTVRFYEFPVEVLKLFQLRYFAMTLDAELSPSISTLWNLEYLIVNRHASIVESSGNPSYLPMPMEIWDMKQLKHLQIMGSDLPDPDEEESALPNLLTLLDVGARSCTKRVLERIPNLRRLGIRIELGPDNEESALSCFDHMSYLSKLLILKCVLVNPIFSIARPTRPPKFRNLDRLSLSGCGYPWEEMRVIGSLRSLMSLKLQCYAFRGEKWETRKGEFPSLQYLSIEDTDLTVWIIGRKSFKRLKRIIIKHCYELAKIEGDLGRVGEIEVVDCSTAAVKQISHIANHARIHSSWEDGKHKT